MDGVECIIWRDKRIVCIINNIPLPSQASTVLRRNKDDSRSPVLCPESVRLYNTYTGGVDVFDSKRKTYSSSRKSRKWCLWLFYFLLDTTVTNAYILYKESVQIRELTMKEFVLRICEHCLSSANCRKRSSVQDPPPAARLCERHFPDRLDKPQQCKVCTERCRTRICLRLAVLRDLLLFARLIASEHTTQNSTLVELPNCTV